jgi:uncharacterized protein YkwD
MEYQGTTRDMTRTSHEANADWSAIRLRSWTRVWRPPIGVVLRLLGVAVLALGLQTAEPRLAEAGAPKERNRTERIDQPDRLIDSINRLRAEAGLGGLAKDEVLDQLATERSADMASRNYFSHVSPEGVTFFDLLVQRGIPFHNAGENLAWNTYGGGQALPVALQGWLDSPAHRDIMFGPDFNEVGLGIASANGQNFLTLVFIARD